MKHLFLFLLCTLFIQADTNSVNTDEFDISFIIPVELSYINTKDDGGLYHAGGGIGFSLEYSDIEFQFSGMVIPYTKSKTLFKSNKGNDTAKYGGSLLYSYDNSLKVGVEYSKFVAVTNEGKNSMGTAYGEMSAYGVKFLYDPIANVVEDKIKSPLVFSLFLGYFDASNMKYTEENYIYSQGYQTVTKKYDLSGPMLTLGIIYKK